jgi:hypothetical protein
MNLAFLVEGSTEFSLYPKWIEHLTRTQLTRCFDYSDVITDQFTIFDVQGIYGMTKGIPSAINDIIANPVFDYLIIVVDADANDKIPSTHFIQNILDDASTSKLPSNCQVKIIIQQVCIETWFMGHTEHFKKAKMGHDRGVLQILNEYDIENDDPEFMPSTNPNIHPIGIYHSMYLKTMLRGANRSWHYRKSTALTIINIPYFQRLEQRLTETPKHLNSFADMVNFLKNL